MSMVNFFNGVLNIYASMQWIDDQYLFRENFSSIEYIQKELSWYLVKGLHYV